MFRNLREAGKEDPETFGWNFGCSAGDGLQLEAAIDGSGPGIHTLPYLMTNCRGSFEVINNSLAKAEIHLKRRGTSVAVLKTDGGAVLEKGGEANRTHVLSPGGPPQSHTLRR